MPKKGTRRDGSKSQAVRDYFKANPGSGPKDVKAELEKAGTSVSLALINKVKYEGSAKKKKKKAGKRRKAAAKKRATRRTRGGTMSEQIRAYMSANPNATRPEIREGLAAQGVTVKASLVNAVYIKARKGPGRKAKPGRRPGRKPGRKAAAGSLSAAELISAKQMIDKMGGIAKVREALGLLEQLQ